MRSLAPSGCAREAPECTEWEPGASRASQPDCNVDRQVFIRQFARSNQRSAPGHRGTNDSHITSFAQVRIFCVTAGVYREETGGERNHQILVAPFIEV